MPLSRIFNIENMSFNALRENKILEKISEFTVSHHSTHTLTLLLNFCKYLKLYPPQMTIIRYLRSILSTVRVNILVSL